MKTLFLMSLLFSAPAFAGVMPLFSQDGKTATFLMAGVPSDPDAVALWNALRIPAEDFSGRLAKKLDFPGPGGAKGLDIDCVFSKQFQGTGSCTTILRAVPGMIEIDRAQGRARLWVTGAVAPQLAAAFVLRDDSTVLYRSQDGRMNITVARDRGVVTDLVVDWK